MEQPPTSVASPKEATKKRKADPDVENRPTTVVTFWTNDYEMVEWYIIPDHLITEQQRQDLQTIHGCVESEDVDDDETLEACFARFWSAVEDEWDAGGMERVGATGMRARGPIENVKHLYHIGTYL